MDLVDVEGVHVVAVVADHPLLHRAEGHADIDPVVVEGQAVDRIDLLSGALGEGQGAGGADRRLTQVRGAHRTGGRGAPLCDGRGGGLAVHMHHRQLPAGGHAMAEAGQGRAGQQRIVAGARRLDDQLHAHPRADVQLVHGQVPGRGDPVQSHDPESEPLDRQMIIVVGAFVADAPELLRPGGHVHIGMGGAVDRLDDPVHAPHGRVGVRRVRPRRRGRRGKGLQHQQPLLQSAQFRRPILEPLDDDRSAESPTDQFLHIAVDMGVVPVEARRLGPGNVHHIVKALPGPDHDMHIVAPSQR